MKTAGLFSHPSEKFNEKTTSLTRALMNDDRFQEEYQKIMSDFELILSQSGAAQACVFMRDKIRQFVEEDPYILTDKDNGFCSERDFQKNFMAFCELLQNQA